MLHLHEDLCDTKKKFITHRLRNTKVAAEYEIETQDGVWDGLSLRQVEFNMIASSFGGLLQRLIPQHRISLSLQGLSKNLATRHISNLGNVNYRGAQWLGVPDCFPADRFSEALISACRMYVEDCSRRKLVPTKVSILVVVGENEGNIYDHRALIGQLLLRNPDIGVLYRSFNSLKTELKLDSDFRLFVYASKVKDMKKSYVFSHKRLQSVKVTKNDEEIAVVYFRTGYTPDAFPDNETWDVKYQLEKSLAIKCPCIQYMLANTKIIQAALSKPKYLSRFFQPNSSSYQNVLSTFANQYTLDAEIGISDSTEIQQVINECMLKPENYVLKPQREGGGNNYFGEQLVQKLKSIMNHHERKDYVLMERIRPYVFENQVLNSFSKCNEPKVQEMVTELGIFGAILV
ncbi:unnamed protein product [Trichobilharzia regenti]|nr:unnamed protein product [Trichobilharzia regenti]